MCRYGEKLGITGDAASEPVVERRVAAALLVGEAHKALRQRLDLRVGRWLRHHPLQSLLAVTRSAPMRRASSASNAPDVPRSTRAAAECPFPMVIALPCRLGLREPERHLHGAVEVNGRCQFHAGLLPLAELRRQGPKAIVAVGLEWAHAQLLGQGDGLAVMGLRFLDPSGIAMRSDVAEETVGMRLVATSYMGMGELKEAFCKCARLGNPHRVFSHAEPFGEVPQFG
jgi:hypothetical protein